MAELIAFPQNRNVGRARHVAAVYLGKPTSKAKVSYWTGVCVRMDASMRRLGFDDPTIGREIEAFKTAVELELARLPGDQNGGVA